MDKDKAENKNKEKPNKPDDSIGLNVSGHIVIRDKQSGQELINKRDS